MKKSIRFVGLDVHKDSVSVAVPEDGRGGEVRRDRLMAEIEALVPSDVMFMRSKPSMPSAPSPC